MAAAATRSHAVRKIAAPAMVYISGEEMTRYTMELIMERVVKPHVDVDQWQFYDLSCVSRDATEDQVLHDAVKAGSEICSIFKEPTVTPTEVQKEKLGLSKAWGSPNGAMRRGWNGITISRDTIHIPGMELGFKKKVIFERHAVGGEYGAGWETVGKGKLRTEFFPEDSDETVVVDERTLKDDDSVVVVYDNPLDNVEDLAHHFFQRCLENECVPYIVTKKTVFKWQESFWQVCKRVFDSNYIQEFRDAGLLKNTGGELQHLISDAATMQIIRWTSGGFGMACHNYDGDMLTDEVAQVHRSPGFITSNLVGKRDDGVFIKEFEASHGTVADMWEAHLEGEETSLNPLGMIEALVSAMEHSCEVSQSEADTDGTLHFAGLLRTTCHDLMASGEGTRDLCGEAGLTTEDFIERMAQRVSEGMAMKNLADSSEKIKVQRMPSIDERFIDRELVRQLFDTLDTDGNGTLDFEEFTTGLVRLGVQPQSLGFKPSK
eukprot:g3358.t1